MPKHPRIPQPFRFFIKLVTNDFDWSHLDGDYQEIFTEIYQSKGKAAALLWIVKQLLNAAVIYFSNAIIWGQVMLKNYLKTTIRNMRRQKVYSLINILGLAVGLCCCLLILLWIQDEKSFDRFNEHAGQIYRIITVDKSGGADPYFAVTPLPMAPAAKNEIPEVLYAARTTARTMKLYNDSDNDNFETGIEEKGLLVSPDFLNMFSFRFLEGSQENALDSSEKMVISATMAQRHFRSDNALGKVLRTKSREFIISGIFQDIPRQSHLNFDYLVNFNLLEKEGMDLNRWMNISFFTYVLLQKEAHVQDVAQKITQLAADHLDELKPTFQLQPLTSLYLDPPYKFDNVDHGSRQSVLFFSLIAAAILVIACINFVNLATARSSRRALEVGLRKVIGARRSLLIKQFFGESLFIVLASTCLALLGVILFLPHFNSITGKDFSLQIFTHNQFLISLLGIVIFTGLASGAYPALMLSSFQPAKIFRGTHRVSSRGAPLRRILIVFQFALTIAVVVGVLVTEKQLRYLNQKDLGYDQSNLMAVYMGRTMARQYETVKQKILQNPNILKATATANLPTRIQSGSTVNDWEGKSIDGNLHFKLMWADHDYLETFQMQLAAGRFFTKERRSDQYEFVLNQAAVAAMELDSPVGKRAVINRTEGTIIGVVKNFHFRSLHHVIEPVALINDPGAFYGMVIRLKPEVVDFQGTIGYLKDLWKEFAPDLTFSYTFLEGALNQLYQGERIFGRLFVYFAGLAIFIACLGLLGMASFTAEQRTKEIGIRKVLGASTRSLIALLLKEFVKWVAISNFIALPIAYLAMSKWLQNYAYHTSLDAGIFMTASLTALLLAVFTVSYQSFRAGMANPVDSLRHE